jgi:hypothetical protein
MSNLISFSKNIYTKDAVYSSITEWKEYLEIEVISEKNNAYNVEIDGDDFHKIQEFLNYVLDKSSTEEIAS